MQTAFCRYFRENEYLIARGVARSDFDQIIHRYKRPGTDRDFQTISFLEIKENCRNPDRRPQSGIDSQKDTHGMVTQLMRRLGHDLRTGMPHIHPVHSVFTDQLVYVMCFGQQILEFSHTGPLDSDWMKWNGQEINRETLDKILAHDLRPDRIDRSMEECVAEWLKKKSS